MNKTLHINTTKKNVRYVVKIYIYIFLPRVLHIFYFCCIL